MGRVWGYNKRVSAVALLDISNVDQVPRMLALADAARRAWEAAQPPVPPAAEGAAQAGGFVGSSSSGVACLELARGC